jgi:hypothetical protein
LGKGLVAYHQNAAWNCEAGYVRGIKEPIGSNVSDWETIGGRRNDNVAPGARVSGDGDGAVVGYECELRLENEREKQ